MSNYTTIAFKRERKCGRIRLIMTASSEKVQVDKYLEAGALSDTYLNEATLTVGVLLFLRRRVRLWEDMDVCGVLFTPCLITFL